jgi:hypothetical protein
VAKNSKKEGINMGSGKVHVHTQVVQKSEIKSKLKNTKNCFTPFGKEEKHNDAVAQVVQTPLCTLPVDVQVENCSA